MPEPDLACLSCDANVAEAARKDHRRRPTKPCTQSIEECQGGVSHTTLMRVPEKENQVVFLAKGQAGG